MPRKTFSEQVLTVFGRIKYFRFPLFLAYDPGSYLVKGEDIRELMDLLQPGDILLRSYTMYLDGKFIPGLFSHAALYVGELNEDHRARAGERIGDPSLRRAAVDASFKTGKQMVIHSMAEGVFVEDILTFTRCDKLVVVRPPEVIRKKDGVLPLTIAEHHFTDEERDVRARLEKGEAVKREEVVRLACAEALRNVGRPYDFDFDFANFGRLSCSELVYFCFKSINHFINIQPRVKQVLFIKKKIIAPDAFLYADMSCVWASRSVREQLMELGFIKPPEVQAPALRAAG
jgi:hypothetical protein